MIHRLTRHVVVRYVLAGGTSAVVDLSALYVLNTLLGMYYLLAATLAFLVAFCVSFTLHKFWTFRTDVVTDAKKQAVLYLGTSLAGLTLNTLLMYIFVDYFHVIVLLSQVFVGGMVACVTFFISRSVVFKYKPK